MTRPCDIIVFGATGFTGRLVAQYLLQAYGAGGEHEHEAPTWAMARCVI
jgi:nucleoside-diphosphate-sugar epimerase